VFIVRWEIDFCFLFTLMSFILQAATRYLKFVRLGVQRILCKSLAAIAGLHPQSPLHFALQLLARVSQTLRPLYISHMTAAAT